MQDSIKRVENIAKRVSTIQNDLVVSKRKKLTELENTLSSIEMRLEDMQKNANEQLEVLKDNIVKLQADVEVEINNRTKLDESQEARVQNFNNSMMSSLCSLSNERSASFETINSKTLEQIKDVAESFEKDKSNMEEFQKYCKRILDEALPYLESEVDKMIQDRKQQEKELLDKLWKQLSDVNEQISDSENNLQTSTSNLREGTKHSADDVHKLLEAEKDTRSASEASIVALAEHITESYLATHMD